MSPQPRQLTRSTAGSLLPGRVRGTALPAPEGESRVEVPLGALDRAAALLTEYGARFITLFLAGADERLLVAVFAFRGELVAINSPLNGARPKYPSLSLALPAAWWPERELSDRFGIEPLAHPDPEPILNPDLDHLRVRASGDDLFVLPYGPVRSGVFEAIQFVIATGGEDVTSIEVRPFFKHRGLERRFEGIPLASGAVVAERVAGIASVAHATAFAQAAERALGVEPPRAAMLWRAVLAELERIANHLDVAARLAEAAALAVGNARFAILKEDVLRLNAVLTGSRFSRGMVVPGGVANLPRLSLDELCAALDRFERELVRDRRLLLGTTSFTDRLIGSGRLDREAVERYGGVGRLRVPPGSRPTHGSSGRTALISGSASPSRSVRTATRWPGWRCASRRSPTVFTCCGRRSTRYGGRTAVCRRFFPAWTALRSGGWRRRRASWSIGWKSRLAGCSGCESLRRHIATGRCSRRVFAATC